MTKAFQSQLNDTNDIIDGLRNIILGIDDGTISLPQARTQAMACREMINAKRLEMQARRVGTTVFSPVSMLPAIPPEAPKTD